MEPTRDQLSIDTPELIAIEMPLAGIGSRFIALLVDSLIEGAAGIVLLVATAIMLPALRHFWRLSANWGIGILLFAIFLLQWGYFALFEAFGSGRTPGKRVARIRVIHQSGRGINFFESLTRNLVRFVDYLPSFYAVGLVTIFLSRRNQRLGDMAAGTLVVRDREIETPTWNESSTRTITAAAFSNQSAIPAPHLSVALPASELARLAPADLEVLEGFFDRRLDMDLATRASLAERIAAALCAKSGLTIPPEISVETFLEAVAYQFRELGRTH
jgi:uncharacterized RDD family membrane protein YckC